MSNATIGQTAPGTCPHCGAPSNQGHFCSACDRILPLAAGGDFFSFFGLPRKLCIDEGALEKAFYTLSRQLHPDYFMNAGDTERQASVDRASRLNDAYRTLRDRTARAQYLLTLTGYKEAEKKAPPDLLEEVFELNMQIEELKAAKQAGDEDDAQTARGDLEEALEGLRDRLKRIDSQAYALFEEWDRAVDREADADAQKKVLDRLSELMAHRSYISNLVRDVREEL